ncbi:MAG: hypothetical protein ACK478_10235 [Flavobacteriales bacterium]|jgi:hypothetical protein
MRHHQIPNGIENFDVLNRFTRAENLILSFYAKSGLINHYTEKLRAKFIGGQLMVIYPMDALF